jgi:hypothetical protein
MFFFMLMPFFCVMPDKFQVMEIYIAIKYS